MGKALSADERARLEELFDEALELTPELHASFLQRECAGNPILAAELGRLLATLSSVDLLGEIQQQAGTPDQAGTSIGPYRLEHCLGQGGMGEVWAATQREPVIRRVALKLIRPGMQSAQLVARFQAERQALARMSHPHVAQVLAAGTSDDGRPYFVMEYVEGEPLTAYCDRHSLPTRARLGVFLDVCDGVRHAHQKGLIHRDLKPNNLLVATQDGRPLVKVIDFGVARAIEGHAGDEPPQTLAGQLVGTLDYMSPEQADPGSLDVDTRSDVYSLGVVLYELVCGFLPLDNRVSPGRSLSEVQRALRENDPPTPSTRLGRETDTSADVARRRGVDRRALLSQLRGDLDWICLRALEKDPERRYGSVGELADDVRRHLKDEPVLARRPSVAYRLRKFVRRNRVGVAAGTLAAVALGMGAWGVVSGRWEAERKAAELALLYDAWRVDPLVAEADTLWPALPGRIPAMEDWLSRAGGVVQRLGQAREGLTRGQAGLGAGSAAPTAEVGELPPDLWASLDVLEHELLAEDGMSEVHGASVSSRRQQARALEAGFRAGGEYARAWEAALPAIRATYPGLELTPQLGLLPLGPDPSSRLWEFAHLPSGAPARRVGGELVRDEDTGLVLVLLPGGTLYVGSGKEEGGPNFVDGLGSFGQLSESPPHLETVPPFFLSKFEVTRAQWSRVTGREPLDDRPDAASDHPITLIDWGACHEFCTWMNLGLPDEWQWEYAARGGKESPWWTGEDPASMRGHANLADTSNAPETLAGRKRQVEAGEPWEDGFDTTAPVGSFPANPFGLHDMLGNVTEWTSSHAAKIEGQTDETQLALQRLQRMARGGSFASEVFMARAAIRAYAGPPTYFRVEMGFRPIRPVDS